MSAVVIELFLLSFLGITMMDRHQSVPNTSSQTSNLENLETKLNAIRLELDKNSHAVSTFVTHSLSAPSDFGCWEERYNFHGESDDEKDGPSSKTVSPVTLDSLYQNFV